jgi:hypothetical protein
MSKSEHVEVKHGVRPILKFEMGMDPYDKIVGLHYDILKVDDENIPREVEVRVVSYINLNSLSEDLRQKVLDELNAKKENDNE